MRKGFTLIELLVVIAIIAILAAILFPPLRPGDRPPALSLRAKTRLPRAPVPPRGPRPARRPA